MLEDELAEARGDNFKPLTDSGGGTWRNYFGGPVADADAVDTTVNAAELDRIVTAISTPPKGFTPHPRLVRVLQSSIQMAKGEVPFDWGSA